MCSDNNCEVCTLKCCREVREKLEAQVAELTKERDEYLADPDIKWVQKKELAAMTKERDELCALLEQAKEALEHSCLEISHEALAAIKQWKEMK